MVISDGLIKVDRLRTCDGARINHSLSKAVNLVQGKIARIGRLFSMGDHMALPSANSTITSGICRTDWHLMISSRTGKKKQTNKKEPIWRGTIFKESALWWVQQGWIVELSLFQKENKKDNHMEALRWRRFASSRQVAPHFSRSQFDSSAFLLTMSRTATMIAKKTNEGFFS